MIKNTKKLTSKFKNIWHHGDYAERKKWVMCYGRSDATLNPGGVRLGTAEIYSVAEKFKNVESIVVSQSWDNDVRIILFLVLNRGYLLDDLLIKKLKKRLDQKLLQDMFPLKFLRLVIFLEQRMVK